MFVIYISKTLNFLFIKVIELGENTDIDKNQPHKLPGSFVGLVGEGEEDFVKDKKLP
jgi:hypothetical protein